jgi:hypothetical protein
MELDIAAGSLDAVAALFLFGHLPSDDQRSLVTRIGEWLREDGSLLATFPTGEAAEEIDPDWLGTTMFFASLGPHAYGTLLQDSGLRPWRDEVIAQNEPDHGDVSFRWVLARKDAA